MPSPVYRSFFVNSGYGFAAAMDALALKAAGADFATCTLAREPPMAVFGRGSDAAIAHYDADSWRDTTRPHLVRAIPTDVLGPFPRARSCSAPGGYAGSRQKVALLTVFEAPVWPAGWVATSNAYDLLSVPGRWLADAAVAADVKTPIRVIPHAMDWPDPMPPPALPPCGAWFDPSPPRTDFKVLVDGTYMARKNLAGAVEAFWRAYNANEATLLVHTHWFSPGHRDRFLGELADIRLRLGKKRYAPVLVSAADLGWRQLWAMYAWADIYLSLSRAEGVGLGLVMAAGLGKAVVATDSPGHRDTVPHARFVAAQDVPASKCLASDPMTVLDSFRVAHIHPLDPWREPSVEDAEAQLRALHRTADGYSTERSRKAAAEARRRHDPAAVGAQLVALAKELA